MIKRFGEFGSTYKEKHEVTNTSDYAFHVLAGDIRSSNTTEKIVNETVDFIRDLDNKLYPVNAY